MLSYQLRQVVKVWCLAVWDVGVGAWLTMSTSAEIADRKTWKHWSSGPGLWVTATMNWHRTTDVRGVLAGSVVWTLQRAQGGTHRVDVLYATIQTVEAYIVHVEMTTRPTLSMSQTLSSLVVGMHNKSPRRKKVWQQAQVRREMDQV